eukprot:4960406-Pyramimonas_sp.AAC.1
MQNAKAEPSVICYSSGMSACTNGKQWQRALSLLSEVREAKVAPSLIRYNAGASAGKKRGQWQQAF